MTAITIGARRAKFSAFFSRSSPKFPGWEQMLTAGAATYALQLAGNALGFDSFWALHSFSNFSAAVPICNKATILSFLPQPNASRNSRPSISGPVAQKLSKPSALPAS
jgi:hypothetical protein